MPYRPGRPKASRRRSPPPARLSVSLPIFRKADSFWVLASLVFPFTAFGCHALFGQCLEVLPDQLSILLGHLGPGALEDLVVQLAVERRPVAQSLVPSELRLELCAGDLSACAGRALPASLARLPLSRALTLPLTLSLSLSLSLTLTLTLTLSLPLSLALSLPGLGRGVEALGLCS